MNVRDHHKQAVAFLSENQAAMADSSVEVSVTFLVHISKPLAGNPSYL